MRADPERLQDIIEAIDKIQNRMVDDFEGFSKDEMLQVWVLHHIQIIGEASARLSPEFREKYSEVMWVDVISMRNVLVHHYFGIDMNQIWDTVRIDIPALKDEILKIKDCIEE